MRNRWIPPALLCAFAIPVVAGERIAFGSEDFGRVELSAFERAVGLNPLDVRDGNQVRVWFDSVMNGYVTGFVISEKSAWRCSLRYVNDNGSYITVNRGSCGGAKHHPAQIARVMGMIGEMSRHDGQSLACDQVLDGWSGGISGMIDGKAFFFTIGNNDGCDDPVSKRIEAFTDLVTEAWKPSKEE